MRHRQGNRKALCGAIAGHSWGNRRALAGQPQFQLVCYTPQRARQKFGLVNCLAYLCYMEDEWIYMWPSSKEIQRGVTPIHSLIMRLTVKNRTILLPISQQTSSYYLETRMLREQRPIKRDVSSACFDFRFRGLKLQPRLLVGTRSQVLKLDCRFQKSDFRGTI